MTKKERKKRIREEKDVTKKMLLALGIPTEEDKKDTISFMQGTLEVKKRDLTEVLDVLKQKKEVTTKDLKNILESFQRISCRTYGKTDNLIIIGGNTCGIGNTIIFEGSLNKFFENKIAIVNTIKYFI